MSEAKQQEANASGGEGKIKKLMLPIFAAFNLVVVGLGGYLVYASTLGYERPSLREPAAMEALQAQREALTVPDGIMYTVPPMVVNLDGYPRRLLKVEMSIEMLDKEGFEEVVSSNALTRDTIMRVLNTKNLDDLETIQGKLALKDQIAVALNSTFKTGVVKDIYFSDFVVQGQK